MCIGGEVSPGTIEVTAHKRKDLLLPSFFLTHASCSLVLSKKAFSTRSVLTLDHICGGT